MEKEPTLDTRPDWIRTNEVATNEIEHGGKKFPYTVLKRELAPTLPGFLGYPNGEHLFISEDVPEKFRAPQLIHEIVEFTELKGVKGRCVEALKRELAVMSEEIRQEYLEYRRNFFAKLIEYYKESKDEDFKVEIQASYEFLQGLK
ncbi:hypothetical protein A3D45_03035 [Candidatus Falkowbacteria bacterium RIFCSPHIGHO2_02_FULL_42_9]|uniref:Uncharacterized protein n=2 Tax=Candidatus Falkowiibacteriota TaxID=1752728 RepID=A0A1F5SAE8_9BACT|nr:MAG: hypothetical protein UU43_C0001G0088 [Candidatus Falkowbacteria bacterium GW2011_GWA2_41_14]OGF23241.1 MAG: hypothetical protein A3D45_03035 [Candidatus Falkowbacteria bacterium RIFCSPHIGHO2_02_FULL_42_9]